ncbi:hypothetical protein HanXRQr2_Chr16g0746091 [Helianthus annuus]|uniref:Uncharacterized protein n=1 Tax=Helianthus annuus TaxID=4232 RepID=A0A251S026_HELAN|nr:hypothetical protein HanXRQr2_Chr16g0746091 [Helianthus annuus]KAJ0821037.1 hypothetical protein HanPSC8_Chr16g0715271 [Helianthus annuus]
MASQVVSGFMMVEALKDKGYNGYAVAVPSANELLQIFKLAAPVFIMMIRLLKSLMIIGAAGTVVPWLFPKVFLPDPRSSSYKGDVQSATSILPSFICGNKYS